LCSIDNLSFFSNNSKRAVTNYLWDFGDGTTSTAKNPTHTYSTPGTYSVSLIITTASGCTDTLTMPEAVKAGSKPHASFTVNSKRCLRFQPVQFTDNSTGNVDQWLWQFGDGGTSTSQNPSYQYQDTGYFSVTLIVWSNTCPDTIRLNDIVHIKPPIAAFTVNRIAVINSELIFSTFPLVQQHGPGILVMEQPQLNKTLHMFIALTVTMK
jgi:PKD repeat protein